MARLHSHIFYALMGIALLLFTTGARADGYYAGIVRGQSEIETDISAGKGTTIDNKSSAGYIFFGREFDNNAAIEGFYANLGKAKVSAKKGSTVTIGKDTVILEEDIGGSGTATSFGVAGKYHFEVHEGVRLSAKLGVHSWRTKYSQTIRTGNPPSGDDGIDAMAGVGVEYAATDKVTFMAGLDNFALEDENVSITYIGVKFSFD